MLRLSQLQDVDVIYDGQRTIVQRAVRKPDQQPIIIKTLRDPHPHFNELVQFRNQYVIARNLDSPHIVSPTALDRCDHGFG